MNEVKSSKNVEKCTCWYDDEVLKVDDDFENGEQTDEQQRTIEEGRGRKRKRKGKKRVDGTNIYPVNFRSSVQRVKRKLIKLFDSISSFERTEFDSGVALTLNLLCLLFFLARD